MRKRLLALVLVACAMAPAHAKTKPRKPPVREPSIRLDLVTGLSFTYDDNVFRYAPDEIKLLKHLPQTDQYSTVETTDDLTVAQSLGLQAYKGDTRITLTVKQNSNYRNVVKGFHNYSIDLRQRVGNAFYTYLTYRYTPRYYIRQIYDVDTMDYESYHYQKHYLALEARKGLLKGRLSLRGHGRYEREKYPDSFQESDFHGFATEAEVRYALTTRFTAGIIANYRRISAKAYDEPWETAETSDDTDGSYHENTFEISGSYELPFRILGSSPSVSFGGSLNKKAFTTERSSMEDPYHAGRADTKVAVETGLSMGLGKGASASLSYKWQKRDVDSYAKDDLGEEKNFRSNTVTLAVSLTRSLIGTTGR